jgi:hypothetical protein
MWLVTTLFAKSIWQVTTLLAYLLELFGGSGGGDGGGGGPQCHHQWRPLYNSDRLTTLICMPRPINHVTKLFGGTYEYLRCPEVFFHKIL